MESADTSRLRRPPTWILGTLVLGLALSVIVFARLRAWERRDLEKRAADLVEEEMEKLRISMLRSIEVLYSITSLLATTGAMEPAAFRAFVRQALARQPELLALSWNPVVPREERAAFEAAHLTLIRERDAAGRLVPAAARAEFVPVCIIEPTRGNEEAIGYDLGSDASRRQALERARATGSPVGTAALQLAQGPRDDAGFLVVLPALQARPTGAGELDRRVAGYAVAVFRVRELVSAGFAALRANGIEAELWDVSAERARLHSTARGKLAEAARTGLEFAEHRWFVAYAPAAGFGGAGSWQSWAVLVAGIGFSAMASGCLLSGWRRTEEVGRAMEALRLEVAERQRAERAAAAANEAKSDFLASMSHEIRTPLNAILGFSQLLERDPHLADEQRDSVAGIRANGLHLLGLVNEVLDLAKIEAGRMELHPVDFNLAAFAQGIAATFTPLCRQKRIALRIALEDGGPSGVQGDEGKLRQILINLLGNAIKFTSAGEVFLGIKRGEGDLWRFEVIDTGQGIPPDEWPDIFEPFHQGRGAQNHGGTGLGLSIARRQVELMGGWLEFESERGRGTRFFFGVPLPQAESHVAALAVEEHSPAFEVSQHLAQLELPPALYDGLTLAADLHSTTALKRCLPELQEHSPGGAHLAEAIRRLMRCYDLDGIQRMLAEATRKESADYETVRS